MNVSDWIITLQNLMAKYGDLPLTMNDEGNTYLLPLFADFDISPDGKQSISICCEMTYEPCG